MILTMTEENKCVSSLMMSAATKHKLPGDGLGFVAQHSGDRNESKI